jgi:D-tyrosyl-tRNA(Tyr) deacylase
MRAVVTRVSEARVEIEGRLAGAIGGGLLVLLGVAVADTAADAGYVARKVYDLRIFRDEAGAMNRSLAEAGGKILVVSQFTLLGDVRKGRRPSFVGAAPPELGRELYEAFIAELRTFGANVATGEFGATMAVSSVNDGPVTLLIDSAKPGGVRQDT